MWQDILEELRSETKVKLQVYNPFFFLLSLRNFPFCSVAVTLDARPVAKMCTWVDHMFGIEISGINNLVEKISGSVVTFQLQCYTWRSADTVAVVFDSSFICDLWGARKTVNTLAKTRRGDSRPSLCPGWVASPHECIRSCFVIVVFGEERRCGGTPQPTWPACCAISSCPCQALLIWSLLCCTYHFPAPVPAPTGCC